MRVKSIAIGLAGMFFSGCIVTTTTQVVEVERTDQEIIAGSNRGYMAGTPSPVQPAMGKKMRQIIRTDVELPTREELEKKPTLDKDLDGNQGYLIKEGAFLRGEKDLFAADPAIRVNEETRVSEWAIEEEEREARSIEEMAAPRVKQAVKESVKQTARFEEYIIQKGDTLQSIAAKPSVYGTTKKWVKIYQANQDVISDPNRVYPGTKIRIPKEYGTSDSVSQ